MVEVKDIKIRRYLEFDKFLKTLKNGLFIPKASLLNDRWEAMVYHMHDYLKERNTAKLLKEQIPTLDDSCIPGIYNSISKGKKEVYVSCWSGTDYECVAMWKLYGGTPYSVMIETNANELIDAFKDFNSTENNEWLACFKDLKYIIPGDDGEDNKFKGKEPLWDNGFKGIFSETFLFHNVYTGLQYKHKSYSFENEYRLLVAHKNRGERQNDGIILPIKKTFIKKVILSPQSSDIFKDSVIDSLRKYNFDNVMVENSILSELPQYKVD